MASQVARDVHDLGQDRLPLRRGLARNFSDRHCRHAPLRLHAADPSFALVTGEHLMTVPLTGTLFRPTVRPGSLVHKRR
jgi:hypothetical protein